MENNGRQVALPYRRQIPRLSFKWLISIEVKKKYIHVLADRWVNVVCLRITSRFWFLTSLSEWTEQFNSSLASEKWKRALTCHKSGIGFWRALSSHSSMANRHILKQCTTDISKITPRHNILMLWTQRLISFGTLRECTSPAGISLSRRFIPRPILSRSFGRPGVGLSRILQSVHVNFR